MPKRKKAHMEIMKLSTSSTIEKKLQWKQNGENDEFDFN